MKTSLKLLLVTILFTLTGTACAGQGSPTPVPTIVVDEACQGMVSHSFVSSVSFPLGETEEGPMFGPVMISFLNDGRVVWKYSLVSYIGEFSCGNGQFEATFTEGAKKSLEGSFVAETNMVRIEEINYLMALDE
jgi:hypothetical protein